MSLQNSSILYTYKCKKDHIFQSKATTRATCPFCKSTSSIRITQEEARMEKESKSTEPSELEVLVDSIPVQKVDDKVFFAKETEPNTFEIGANNAMNLHNDDIKEIIELGNFGLEKIGGDKINDNEVTKLLGTLNKYFKDNKIISSNGKTSIFDVIMELINVLLPKFIPIIVKYATSRGVKL